MPLHGEYAPSASEWVRTQVADYEASDGTVNSTIRGLPIVVVTSMGARSGRLRKNPVMRVEHAGEYAVVASAGGAEHSPQWYHNLVAQPLVELQDGAVRQDMQARLVSGEERGVWWERAVAAFDSYADYAEATEREIPVFVLSPTDAGS